MAYKKVETLPNGHHEVKIYDLPVVSFSTEGEARYGEDYELIRVYQTNPDGLKEGEEREYYWRPGLLSHAHKMLLTTSWKNGQKDGLLKISCADYEEQPCAMKLYKEGKCLKT